MIDWSFPFKILSKKLSVFSIPAFEQYRPISPIRPGVIVCQGTGEEYAIQDQSPSSSAPSPSLGEQEVKTLLKMVENSKLEQTNKNRNTETISYNKLDSGNGESTTTDEGLGETMSRLTTSNGGDSNSLTDTLVYTSCSADGEESSTTPTALSFATTTATTAVNTTTSCTTEEDKNTQHDVDTIDKNRPSSSNTDGLKITQSDKNHDFNTLSTRATADHGHDDFGDFHSASTPKHAPFTSPSNTNSENKHPTNSLSLKITTGNNANENHVTNINTDSSITSDSGSEIDNVKKSKFHHLQRPPSFEHASKDSGISDMTTSGSIHSTTVGDSSTELNSPDKKDSRSSLSDEARKWLGKHSISSGMSRYMLSYHLIPSS